MSQNFGLIIESLVAVLLVLTISFCIVLNRRLKKLRADEVVALTVLRDKETKVIRFSTGEGL